MGTRHGGCLTESEALEIMHHQFHPSVYFNTIGPRDPVLTVDAGDRITTTTVDAWGADEHDRTVVADAENPQTGPFFVAGCRPGNTLVFKPERIRPNRTVGYSLAAVISTALDFGTVPHFDIHVDRAVWDLDN